MNKQVLLAINIAQMEEIAPGLVAELKTQGRYVIACPGCDEDVLVGPRVEAFSRATGIGISCSQCDTAALAALVSGQYTLGHLGG